MDVDGATTLNSNVVINNSDLTVNGSGTTTLQGLTVNDTSTFNSNVVIGTMG